MKKYNEDNERIKRKYLTFLKQAKGQNEASIDAIAKAISCFDLYNRYKILRYFILNKQLGLKSI
jgi:integrase/recombinase XerD